MTSGPEFALLPVTRLKAHELIDAGKAAALAEDIRERGVFDDPIWVAAGSWVILNGHHRVAALRRLGAHRIPAWVLDYESDVIRLEPWNPGPPIPKAEVVRRGVTGDLFAPKTTRHFLNVTLPSRHVPLEDLMNDGERRRPPVHRRGASPSRALSAEEPSGG